ncbi:amino acid permease [Vagococcus martis]|uniref:Amino acid permease n=1 Tax=Vagococcus martis TaxID=1768210 RepID=A0A1V4DGK0_9ENTE|nr:amino acid permease [Vagococcus martis]OPF87625.1 amino acid permease [Vagococcus martis]
MDNKSGIKTPVSASVKPVASETQATNTASKKGALSKITLATFIGLTFSLVAGPYYSTLTATGWNMFLFMGIAVIGFALPIALISGEFGTTFPGQGGPELWVKNTLGPKWGFVTSWLIWAAMFPSMVVVGTGFAPMVALLLKKESLIENSMFTLAVILGLVWCMTLLNLKFDMAKVNGKFGIWLGLYIPVVMLFILGVFTFVKIGLNPDSILGTFSWSKLVPKSFTSGSGMYFSGIIFIFLGIEMSSVFITRLKKPSQQYAKGVITSLILLALFSLVNSFLVANVIPAGKIQLNNGAQPLQLFADRLGLPYFVVQIFCLLSIVSVLTNMSTWFISAQKTITASAREGDFPEKFKFWKTNKFNSSNTLLFVQAIAITILSGAYVVIPGINKVFVIITNSGTMIYCLAYTLMALGFIAMRRKSPDTEHPFRVGKKGNGLGFFFAGLLMVTIVFALTLTFMSNTIENLIFVLIFVGILFSIPLIIYNKKKASWLTDVQKEMAKDSTQTTNK